MSDPTQRETQAARVARVLGDPIEIVDYDPAWPEAFAREKAHLLGCLPGGLIGRVEHFGSTAVPGLAAKPIVDLLVEVADLGAARERIAPVLEAEGYDYFWRPTRGDDVPPFYAFFIKRDAATGQRTHHVHMIENTPTFAEHWAQLKFRDCLIADRAVAGEYERLKRRLAVEHPNDRIAYTEGKGAFIRGVMARLGA